MKLLFLQRCSYGLQNKTVCKTIVVGQDKLCRENSRIGRLKANCVAEVKPKEVEKGGRKAREGGEGQGNEAFGMMVKLGRSTDRLE